MALTASYESTLACDFGKPSVSYPKYITNLLTLAGRHCNNFWIKNACLNIDILTEAQKTNNIFDDIRSLQFLLPICFFHLKSVNSIMYKSLKCE